MNLHKEISFEDEICQCLEAQGWLYSANDDGYDRKELYMIIRLNDTYYHYCEIDSRTVQNLMAAPSMGRYYNSAIKENFDCRVKRMPPYK